MSDETAQGAGESKIEKVSMVVFSGDMDKVMAAFIMATGSAAFDMQVSMFFTFWGLKALQKGNPTGTSWMGKALSFMNRGGVERLGPSKLNFGGLGRILFNKMMKKSNVKTLAELRQDAINLGVKFVVCEMSMRVMEIERKDLIDADITIGNVGTFIGDASESCYTLFI